MARIGTSLRRRRNWDFIRFIITMINCVVLLHLLWYSIRKTLHGSQYLKLDKKTRRKRRMHNLNRMIRESDTLCRNYLRINRYTFGVLLEMVRDIGGLNGTKNTCLEEIVAAAHFYRSGETVSRQFHACLLAILKLHDVLLKKPTPIQEDCHKIGGNISSRMEESSASGGGRGRNKRLWTKEEDKVLVEALSELAVDPHWRCEAGFRNGYMTRLEEDIGKALPGCGLKATPHIDSRLKTLSTKFRAIAQMLSTSGFAWDDERKMISVDRAVYDEFCKSHPNCKNLYGVAFPHFHELMNIYGKDYATGKPAEGFVEAVNNLQKDAPAQVLLDSSDDDDDDGCDGSGNATQTHAQTVESAPLLKRSKKKNLLRKGGELVKVVDVVMSWLACKHS
ncbi:hypothetical protein RDABS01_022261 [Bienertia sinuspersici]